MGDNGDLSAAGRAGGVAGWDGGERRQGERRTRDGSGGDVKRGPDRRQSQYCHACGKKFQPTASQKRICPACRGRALRMGQPAGRWGGV